MNKSELLSLLTEKSIKVINIESVGDSTKENAGINTYIANVFEALSDDSLKASARNIMFYVVDEGQVSEKAYLKDDIPKSVEEYNLAKEVSETKII